MYTQLAFSSEINWRLTYISTRDHCEIGRSNIFTRWGGLSKIYTNRLCLVQALANRKKSKLRATAAGSSILYIKALVSLIRQQINEQQNIRWKLGVCCDMWRYADGQGRERECVCCEKIKQYWVQGVCNYTQNLEQRRGRWAKQDATVQSPYLSSLPWLSLGNRQIQESQVVGYKSISRIQWTLSRSMVTTHDAMDIWEAHVLDELIQ